MRYKSLNYFLKMSWWDKLIICLFIFFDLSISFSQETVVGIWQDAPSLGSGWGENYRFFEDGSFVFSHSQMDCQDSIISMGGFYSIKRKRIKLKFIVIEYIEGGTLVPASGSCGSEFALEGGTVTTDSYIKKQTMFISKITQDPEFDHLHYILLNGHKFWKLGWDPKEY